MATIIKGNEEIFMQEYMVHYSVKKDQNAVIGSDLRQAKVIEARNEEEARKKLYEVEPREINYISSVRLFSWKGLMTE